MRRPVLTYTAQAVAGLIMLYAALLKFQGAPMSVEAFSALGMEPTGRYLIGCLELLAGLMLLSPFAALGAMLTAGVMCGAVIAHATRLGISMASGDGSVPQSTLGPGIFALAALGLVIVCALYVLISRRKELPFIGDTL